MSTKTKGKQGKGSYSFTAEDIKRERDDKKQSWRAVATALGLSSPGAARTAYTELTGVPHYESQVKVHRQPRQAKDPKAKRERNAGVLNFQPDWKVPEDDAKLDALQEEIIQRLQPDGPDKVGATILVQRSYGFTEEITVGSIQRFSFEGKNDDKLVVHFYDAYNGGARAVDITTIKEVYR